MTRLAGSLVALAACTSPPSTNEIDATFDVRTQDDGSLVLTLQLLDSSDPASPLPYALSPSEGARAEFRGQRIPLVAGTTELYGPAYVARVAPDPAIAADESIVATFDRGGHDVAELAITAPPDLALVAATTTPQPVTVTWSPPSSDPLTWTADSDCRNERLDGPIPHDTGRIDFPAGVLAPATPLGRCGVTLLFMRSRGADGSPRLRSAVAYFSRTRSVQLEVTP